MTLQHNTVQPGEKPTSAPIKFRNLNLESFYLRLQNFWAGFCYRETGVLQSNTPKFAFHLLDPFQGIQSVGSDTEAKTELLLISRLLISVNLHRHTCATKIKLQPTGTGYNIAVRDSMWGRFQYKYPSKNCSIQGGTDICVGFKKKGGAGVQGKVPRGHSFTQEGKKIL